VEETEAKVESASILEETVVSFLVGFLPLTAAVESSRERREEKT
jgi:hypothetical protein